MFAVSLQSNLTSFEQGLLGIYLECGANDYKYNLFFFGELSTASRYLHFRLRFYQCLLKKNTYILTVLWRGDLVLQKRLAWALFLLFNSHMLLIFSQQIRFWGFNILSPTAHCSSLCPFRLKVTTQKNETLYVAKVHPQSLRLTCSNKVCTMSMLRFSSFLKLWNHSLPLFSRLFFIIVYLTVSNPCHNLLFSVVSPIYNRRLWFQTFLPLLCFPFLAINVLAVILSSLPPGCRCCRVRCWPVQ